jgi:GDPmannose 4,6-dehydratase
MKTALITGVSGQDGAYLAKLLLDKGYRVVGTVRRKGEDALARLRELAIERDVEVLGLDLLEYSNVMRTVARVEPDEVYNLAAQSFVAASFEQPIYTCDVSGLGAVRMLEVVREVCPSARFYQASTSEMFGNHPENPKSEATPFRPRSPYAMAKVLAHHATVNYRESYGLFACSGILFNHESPLRGSQFVTRRITQGFARIAEGQIDCLTLGTLDARRDWGHAADYVEGMWRMLQAGEADDYVLATGESHSVRDFAEKAAAWFGWTLAWEGEGVDEVARDARSGRTLIRIDATHFRPAEVDVLVGDPTEAERQLGWKRSIDFDGLVTSMCAADHERVKAGRVLF